MKLFYKGTDGGDKSNVTGYWLIEAKSLFSIVLLRFGKGSRENFHSHAFNAVTWFIKGEVDELHMDGRILRWNPSFKPKLTPKNCYHNVYAREVTWALSFRGPWDKTWKEYSPREKRELRLTEGRIILDARNKEI